MRRRNYGILAACLFILAGVVVLYWPKGKLDLGLRHSQKIYDLGTGKAGSELKRSVRVWNLGLRPVTIEGVSACCGASAELRGGKSKVVGPFRSAVIDVKIYVPGEEGSSLKSIELSMSRGQKRSFDYLVFQYYSSGKAAG